MKFFRTALLVSLIFCSFFVTRSAYASQTAGTIDPLNAGSYFTAFVHVPSTSGSEIINFGKFSLESHYDITISDNGLRGFAWGSEAGWIVMNCADTTSGCSTANANFKVAIDANGKLSGYAWGQKAGWINFGPFLNNSTAQVQINQSGQFNGYAWSERYGWIVFNCSVSSTCVTTDYIPSVYRQTSSTGGATPPRNSGHPLDTTTPPDSVPVVSVIPPPSLYPPSNTGAGNSTPPPFIISTGSGSGHVTQPVSPPSITVSSTPGKKSTGPNGKSIAQPENSNDGRACIFVPGIKGFGARIACWFTNLVSSFNQHASMPVKSFFERIKLFLRGIKI
ncbi:MAG TPA: hypothetical protein VFE57_05810 [Cyclobacteriaceae bacterium]|jgi:hypothetical protein|nr:hypothetical protein [Cyclobacteriaceae bacterium]